MTQHKVLLISHDIVGPSMAGPGIRNYHLARVLSDHANVTLAIPSTSKGILEGTPFRIERYDLARWDSLLPFATAADILVFPSDVAFLFPQLEEVDAYKVIDGYDPLLAEWLALNSTREPDKLSTEWRDRLVQLLRQYSLGDFYICASERQRDWWLGLLESNGRLNPSTFQDDPSLRKLIDVVAYGLPDNPPVHSRDVIKGVWKGIGREDKLLLWGGGLWSWLDPLTAIEATSRVYERRQDVRLIFPGTKHPNPALGAIPSHNRRAKAMAKEYGLLNKAVFFGDWVPYADWQNLLLESDIALTLHFDTVETRLAFRSRVLEYIWAGLPTIATSGDATAEILQRYELGAVVGYNDVDGVVEAILAYLERQPERDSLALKQAIDELSWRHVAQPLIRYCQNPWHSADRGGIYNPNMWEQMQQDREYYEKLVKGYESGYYIRTMKWLDQRKTRILNRLFPPD